MVQWLRLHALTTGGTGLTPGQGTKIPLAARHGQKIKYKLKNNKVSRAVVCWRLGGKEAGGGNENEQLLGMQASRVVKHVCSGATQPGSKAQLYGLCLSFLICK